MFAQAYSSYPKQTCVSTMCDFSHNKGLPSEETVLCGYSDSLGFLMQQTNKDPPVVFSRGHVNNEGSSIQAAQSYSLHFSSSCYLFYPLRFTLRFSVFLTLCLNYKWWQGRQTFWASNMFYLNLMPFVPTLLVHMQCLNYQCMFVASFSLFFFIWNVNSSTFR